MRELLIEAAEHVFSQQGYSGGSTRQIAEEAGVTEVLIFRHFGTKRGLFEAAIVEPFSQLLSAWVEDVTQRASAETDEELVREFATNFYEMVLENRGLLLALVAASTHADDSSTSSSRALTSGLDELARFVGEQAEQRSIQGLDLPVSIGVTLSTMVGMALLDPWLFGASGRPGKRRIIDELSQFLSYGIVGRP